MLGSLRPSIGSDELHLRTLKEFAGICHFFQQSIGAGEIPKEWLDFGVDFDSFFINVYNTHFQ